jgi:hypothetical protein
LSNGKTGKKEIVYEKSLLAFIGSSLKKGMESARAMNLNLPISQWLRRIHMIQQLSFKQQQEATNQSA